MEFFLKWLIFASVAVAATVAPGPAFAHTVRTSIVYGRRAAILSAIGLTLGVMLWVTLVMAGFALVLSQSVVLFNVLRYLGAAYLVYMGLCALRAKPAAADNLENGNTTFSYKKRSDKKAFLSGIAVNLTNPKAVIYFTAIFAQFITPDMLLWQKILYACTPILTEMTWFSLVATVLTQKTLRQRFTAISHWIERICGGLMIALGLKLAISKI